MRIVLTNLSDKSYEESRFRLNISAGRFGIDEIQSYDFEQLKNSAFYAENKVVLDQPTGMGFWLWKPYIIQQALTTAAEASIIIYSDSGIEIIAPLGPLIKICSEDSAIVLFGNGDLHNSMWTKRDCFLLMDSHDQYYWKAPHCDAASALGLKYTESMQFV